MSAGKYETHVEPKLTLIAAWARDGLTDEDIAKNLDVSVASLSNYKRDHLELLEALKVNKEEADIKVENSLYKRAIGFEYDEVTQEPLYDGDGIPIRNPDGTPKIAVTKIVRKQVVPDTTAQIFWLKNRKPGAWRDKHELDVKSEVVNKHEYHIRQTIQSDPEAAAALRLLYKRQAASALNAPMGDSSE